jgi:DNA-directed RNA polymerase subunit F
MIVLSRKPLSISETLSNINDFGKNIVLEEYFKKFSKLSKEKALALAEAVRSLNNIKVKEEHIIKVVDFVPKDSEEVNKIFNDVSLNEEEINKILAITKEY